MLIAIFLYPFLPCSTAGVLCVIKYFFWSSLDSLHPPPHFTFHWQLSPNRPFHIFDLCHLPTSLPLLQAPLWDSYLPQGFPWTGLKFHKDCQPLTNIPSDIPVSKISITHSKNHWAGRDLWAACTWTPLDETLQDISLDVGPSTHLWKISVIDWEIGSKLNIMHLETDVQHITVTQREPSRPYDSSSNPWCTNWRLRGREKCVHIKLWGWRVWSTIVLTEKEKLQQHSSLVVLLGKQYPEGWGTTTCCLSMLKGTAFTEWTCRTEQCPQSSHEGETLPPTIPQSVPLLPWVPCLPPHLEPPSLLTNFIAAIQLCLLL